MWQAMNLETYRRKRDFDKTSEPSGKKRGRAAERLSFVVQKHAARRLHYDFRLEMGGALASWAVPKGPSLNPKERRLAVQVEDHPIEYGDFEGTIPQGEYGAGSVIVWDRGSWTPDGDPIAGRRKGRLKFHLNGEKLKGGWTLVRMKPRSGESKDNWLLIKEADQNASKSDIVNSQPKSVKSGRRLERKNSITGTRRSQKHRSRREVNHRQSKDTKKSKMPAFYQPQLATLVDRVPPGDDWLHEIKFDGYRIICRVDNGRASLFTREAHDWTERFSVIADAAKALPVRQAVFDGEIVALKDDGTSDFQLLQNSLREKTPVNLSYFVFDLLFLDGRDLTASPLLARKELLEKIFKDKQKSSSDLMRFSEHWIGEGQALYQKACDSGLEGIISKRIDQPYRPTRSRDWLKIKCVHNQEFVIGGFTEPAGSRSGLGALLLGVYDDNESLHYAGRVGTGFTQQTLTELRARLDKLEQGSSPFVAPPPTRRLKDVRWVKPALVGEVAFTQWTQDNVLRHPSFRGLREDKSATEVRRENIAPTSKVISSNGNPSETKIAGIELTHPDRVLYPEQGITKIELARYYEEIADWILPHIERRPLTLVRCPEGHKQQCFYQRHAQGSIDPAIHPVKVKEKGSVVPYLAIDSLAGLIALVQMGVLEIHTWGARSEHVDQPDQIIFDLDPDPAVSWTTVKQAALTLRKRLTGLGLAAFLKTTGGKGLHIVVPIVPKHDWSFIKEFTKAVAQSVVRENPDRFIATMSKAKRKGKIFIDYLRNAKTATAVCAYSTRARSGASVSTPLRWEELKDDVRAEFTIRSVPKRLARLRKDPWDGFEAARASITNKMLKQL
jgi:bifunctional non-homologous end joining protein LigD